MSDYDDGVHEIAQHSPHTRWSGDSLHGRYPKMTAVWVRLDAIVARVPGQPHHVVPDGLDMTGEVPGLLTTWFASALGDWCGLVNYEIPYADGRRHKLSLHDQLVPAYALRKRTEPGDEADSAGL